MEKQELMAAVMPEIMQSESIKIIKNTKGYGWEIRILSLDVERLSSLNNEMLRRFGDMSQEEMDLRFKETAMKISNAVEE